MKNKIALVTGGTSGIGKEIVKQLLINGVVVFANFGHDENKMLEVKEEFKEYIDKLYFFKADVSNELEVIEMFNFIKSKYDRLDFLVNNAGINEDAYIENFDIKKWKEIINVNLVGKVICTKNAIDLLKNSSYGSIVNIASRLGTKPCEMASAYCASESGVINFTQASALELSKYNIRVNCVSPSLTITPLSLKGWTNEEIEETKNNNPLKKLGETIDIANSVLFLLSEDSSYITGNNLNVNGGALL